MLAAAGGGLALLLVGCGKGGLAPDPEAEAVAKTAYADLAAGRTAQVMAVMLPAIAKQTAPETLTMLQGLIPKTPPTGVERLNWQAFVGTGGSTQTFRHRYDYGTRQVVATSVLMKTDGQWRMQTFNINLQMAPAAAADAAKGS